MLSQSVSGVTLADSAQQLYDAEMRLKTIVHSRFDDAVHREDAASVERFFKIFPLLDMHADGISKFSKYLSAMVIFYMYLPLSQQFFMIHFYEALQIVISFCQTIGFFSTNCYLFCYMCIALQFCCQEIFCGCLTYFGFLECYSSLCPTICRRLSPVVFFVS